MDSGADLLLAFSEQEAEQGLRAAGRDQRGANLRGHDAVDGEAFGPCLRLFGQFQGEVLRKRLPRVRAHTVEGKPTRKALRPFSALHSLPLVVGAHALRTGGSSSTRGVALGAARDSWRRRTQAGVP